MPAVSRRAQVLRILAASAAVFAAALAAIIAVKMDLRIAAFWPANAIALIFLVRWRSVSDPVGLWAGVLAAMMLANLVAGNTLFDSITFTAGNFVEITVAYRLLRSGTFAAALAHGQAQLMRIVQRLLVAAIVAPACGAVVGALGLSWSSGSPFTTLWLQWWLPSALSMLIVAPFGLLVTRQELAALRSRRALIDLTIVAALLAVSIAAIFATERMAMIMLSAPGIMYAALRLRTAGALIAVFAIACVLIPIAASPDFVGRFSVWSNARQLLAAIEAYLVIQGIIALATAGILTERDSLLSALAASQTHSADQAQSRLRLLMNIAHEIRSPLNAIQGCAELVEVSGPLTAKQEELLNAVKGASRQLQTLAGDLLDTARIEHGALFVTPQRIDPGPILAEVLAEVSANTPFPIRAAVDAPDGLKVWADPLRFRQIAVNLVTNAIKFGGGHGSIRILLRRDGDETALSVCDQGPGFAPGAERMAFEPFARQQRADGVSAGVGLSLVKQLVEAHGGSVSLVSTPYIETRVEARFPDEHSANALRASTARGAVDSLEPDLLFIARTN
jgi:signal transduction histidine kinase